MKNLHYLLQSLFLFIIALSLIQCSKDDNSPKNNNFIKMNGVDFPIISASMIGVSNGDNGHTGIALVSGNETQANTLTIDVESFTQATIEGHYAYPEETGKKKLDYWLTNYSAFNESTMHSSNLESGDVSISLNSGNNYTIDMNLTMVDGVTFTGSYSGEFQVMFYNHQ